MSLHSICGTSTQNDDEQVFYKVVVEQGDRFVTPVTRSRLKMGQTSHAEVQRRHMRERQRELFQPSGIPAHKGGCYPPGFHLLTSVADTEWYLALSRRPYQRSGRPMPRFAILELRARGIHTVGKDRTLLTVVATEVTPLRVLEPMSRSVGEPGHVRAES